MRVWKLETRKEEIAFFLSYEHSISLSDSCDCNMNGYLLSELEYHYDNCWSENKKQIMDTYDEDDEDDEIPVMSISAKFVGVMNKFL